MNVLRTEKVTAVHWERMACVYVRQSTPHQVREHRASRENQYALVDRAIALGWRRDRIQIIDDDLGRSGRDGQRPGFRALVSAVSLGQVSLVLAYEASRLARSNADWYTLLDLAALAGALIADVDGVFDPRRYDDRLLLGLRGMLSEAELHLYRLRTEAGRQRHIAQATYRQNLPTGLTRLEDGRVVQDPDQQVRHALELVFTRFAALGSCPKVLRSLQADGVLLPRRQTGGLFPKQLLWKAPTDDAIYEILQNPAYAGAFVYGRTTGHPERRPGQRGRAVRRPLAEWVALHHGVYPAFITWEQYMANQERLTENLSNYARRLHGAARQGDALLAGLVVCGHCGRQMGVAYKPTGAYFCRAVTKTHSGPRCLFVAASSIEPTVTEAVFAALAPAELDLLEDVLAAQRQDQDRVRRQHADQVARAEYEARLAERRYVAVDPDNRLVAADLERRWDQALHDLRAAREAAEHVAGVTAAPDLDADLRQQLQSIGTALPALWASGRLTPLHKKEVLRTLIRRVILTRRVAERVEIKIVWISGAYSILTAELGIQNTAALDTYPHLVDRIRALSVLGHDDDHIARQLTAEGFRRARQPGLTGDQVGKIRRANGIASIRSIFRQHAQVNGQWTTAGITQQLGISRKVLYALIAHGLISATKHPVTGHVLIPAAKLDLEWLRSQLGQLGEHTDTPSLP
jgi:DNA invertase Pin-like site-specific DNA recombinase